MHKGGDNNIVKTRTGVLRWDQESKILFVDVDEGARETLKDAISNNKLAVEITQNTCFGMLIDITKIGNIDAEARNFYATNTNTKSLGVAMLTNSVISRVLGNFFIGINKPIRSVKLFADKVKATEWLQQLIADNPTSPNANRTSAGQVINAS